MINSTLQLDPASKERLAKLNNKIISIELLPFHFIFYCVFTENGVTIETDSIDAVATSIRGTPLQLFGMLFNKDQRQRFFAEDVVITGDAELGQQVINLLDELHIDWEDYLSIFIGDIPAHHASRFARGIAAWVKQTKNTFTQDINDYIHEEIKWFPAREALQDFFTEVDNLRMDVDRLAARVLKNEGK